MKKTRIYLLLLMSAAAAVAPAQTFPFQLVAVQSGNALTLANGATITFNAVVGQTQTAEVTATFSGSGTLTISSPPSVVGSASFKAAFSSQLPLMLNPGDSIKFSVQFTPANASQATGQLSFPFSQVVASPGSGISGTTTAGTIALNLVGDAAAFVESYALQTNQNVVPLPPTGATIPFPPTLVNSSSQATLYLNNTGSGPGTVTGITISGAAFHLMNVPLLPATVPSGQALQVQVVYQPAETGSDSGQITVTFGAGPAVLIGLQGGGNSAKLTYQIVQPPPAAAITPGATITIPGTKVGQTSAVTIQVANSGNAPGVLSSITVSGAVFQLSGVPPLPATLAPDASLNFILTFTPSQPGTQTGSLIINSDVFNLSGGGTGASLQFSYSTGGVTVPLDSNNNSVIFSPVMITTSAQITLDVKNSGTAPAILPNIGIGQTSSPFAVTGVPPLPAQLAAGGDLTLTIKFTPTTLGFSNGTLIVGSATINLLGSGTQPPPIPDYTLSGPSGDVPGQTQPNVTLTLASPYPVDLTGVLTMKVAGALPADPAVQFATGGRSVPFVIPANATSAIFDALGPQIGLQTGTVATTITLTPSFATLAGNIDLTPANPQGLKFNVAAGPPTLVTKQLIDPTNTGFMVEVTGFSPTRTLTAANVQFTTAPGFTMQTSQFTINVQDAAIAWFATSASQAFGGQFTIQIPFTFQENAPANQPITASIASVAVTVSNEKGASNSLQAKVN